MVTLVTGASGFIGSAVVQELMSREETVRVLVRRGSDRSNLLHLDPRNDLDYVVGDLTHPSTLEPAMEGVRSVYHIAADYRLWAPTDEDIYRANVDGTLNVLRAAADAGAQRIVYTSSVCTLKTSLDGIPANETDDSAAEDLIGAYKKSKFLAERHAQKLADEGAPIVIVNPSTPIGPRDIKPTPTGRTILDAGLGKIPAYVNTGLNFVHVDDVARGHLLAHDKGVPGERYILGGHNLSLKSLLCLIADMTGQPSPKIELPRHAVYPVALISELVARATGGQPLATVNGLRLSKKMMYFSSSKAERELGYSFRPVQDALEDALSWFGINVVNKRVTVKEPVLIPAAP